MSLERAKEYLAEKGYADHVIELEDSSATVQLAAQALGVEPGMIAKTMSFLIGEEAILILTEGIKVYLDESLKQFDTVYPAAGNDHSAVKLTIAELEEVAGAVGWVNVCKELA